MQSVKVGSVSLFLFLFIWPVYLHGAWFVKRNNLEEVIDVISSLPVSKVAKQAKAEPQISVVKIHEQRLADVIDFIATLNHSFSRAVKNLQEAEAQQLAQAEAQRMRDVEIKRLAEEKESQRMRDAQAQQRAKEAAEAQRKQETEVQLRAQAEAQKIRDVEIKRLTEEKESQRMRDAQAQQRAKEAAEAQRKQETEAQLRAEAEAQKIRDAQARQLAEEAKQRAKEEELKRIQNIKDKRAQQAQQYTALKKSDPMGEIEVTDLGQIACDAQGFPTETALKEAVISEFFLQKPKADLTGEAKINFDKKEADLKQNLEVKKVDGGNFTQEIYSVFIKKQPTIYGPAIVDSDRSILFLKISARDTSAKKLAALQKGAVGRLRIESKYANVKMKMLKKELPIITWVEKIFKYKNSFGAEKLIEVTHAAHGQSALSILRSSNETLEEKIKCARAIGAAIGSFQNLFMDYNSDPKDPNKWRTVCHADFHTNNIFFDEKTSRVYLIDNETMKLGCIIELDVGRFFADCMGIGLQSKSIEGYKNYSKIGAAFLQEYIDTFSNADIRITLVNYFKKLILEDQGNSLKDFVIYYLEASIIADANKSMQKEYNFSHLEVSVAQGNVDEVEKILKEKNVADFINQKDKYGNTALYWAVRTENEEIVTLLCQAGADVKLTYTHDNTVLHYAVALDNEKIVKTLIASGADLAAFNKDNAAPLKIALERKENLKKTWKGIQESRVDTGEILKKIDKKEHEIFVEEVKKYAL